MSRLAPSVPHERVGRLRLDRYLGAIGSNAAPAYFREAARGQPGTATPAK